VKRPIHQKLSDCRRRGPGFFWLIDPDKIDTRRPDPRWERAGDIGVTAVLVGTSQDNAIDYSRIVAALREHTALPLILFPGSASQVVPGLDAVLFLSLLSGRNPEYLVTEQVKGTPLIHRYGIEPIPTGYVLIDTGTSTSVAVRTGTMPIPERETESIRNHALCAQYMGHAFVYLEAGSGAQKPISAPTISSVKDLISIPLVVGGGLKTPAACADAVAAGADFIVVGTALENDRSTDLLAAMVNALSNTHRTVNV
jgi:phosphoglycerol geranylgeranyltransferase